MIVVAPDLRIQLYNYDFVQMLQSPLLCVSSMHKTNEASQ